MLVLESAKTGLEVSVCQPLWVVLKQYWWAVGWKRGIVNHRFLLFNHIPWRPMLFLACQADTEFILALSTSYRAMFCGPLTWAVKKSSWDVSHAKKCLFLHLHKRSWACDSRTPTLRTFQIQLLAIEYVP